MSALARRPSARLKEQARLEAFQETHNARIKKFNRLCSNGAKPTWVGDRGRYQALRSIYLHRIKNFAVMTGSRPEAFIICYGNSREQIAIIQKDISELTQRCEAVAVAALADGVPPELGEDKIFFTKATEIVKYIKIVKTTIWKFKFMCELEFLDEWRKLPGHIPLEVRSHIASFLVPINGTLLSIRQRRAK
jgi:hypothetical protein